MTNQLKIGKAAELLGVSAPTLRNYEKRGQITSTRTTGNQRLYNEADILALKAGDKPASFDPSQPTQKQRTITPDVRQVSDFGPSVPRQVLYDEFGTTGLRQWGGSVFEERLRELRGREGRILYREMRLNDPVIAAIFFALVQSLKQAKWRVKPASESDADKLAAEFIDTCLVDLSWSWSDQLTFAIEPTLEQGFSLLETTYKRRLGQNPPKYIPDPAKSLFNDGRIGWRKHAPRPAETLTPGREWVFDDNGGIQGIWQSPISTFDNKSTRFIPIQKLLHFRTTVHPANTPEGIPIHRAMYLPYYFSKQIQQIEGIGIERDLGGIPVMYLGENTKKQGPNNEYDIAVDLVTNIRMDEQVGVVIPAPKMGSGAREGQGMLLELLTTGGTRQYDTTEILNRYDKQKAVSVLAQFIMLGLTQVGSFALSKHQGDLWTIAAGAFLDHIANTFNRFAIPKLIMLNVFPGITGFPKLEPGVLGIPNLEDLSKYVNLLVGSDVLTPDMELERHLRQVADLPEPSEETAKNKTTLRKLTETMRGTGLALSSAQKLNATEQSEIDTIMKPQVEQMTMVFDNEDKGEDDED